MGIEENRSINVMRITLDTVTAGNERSVDLVGIDIHALFVLQPGDLGCGRIPTVIDCSTIEVPIIMGIIVFG